MTVKFYLMFFVSILLLISCGTSKSGEIDYARLIRNTTFSDVHRNPKVVANEYFEFKGTTFSYARAQKSFDDQYFQRSAYEGIFVILDNSLLLTVQKMLFCDKEVIGQNKVSKKDKNANTEAKDRCTYSFYDIKVLRAKGLIKGHTFEMPTRFKITKAANSTKIIAENGTKGKIYENKKPQTY